MEVVQTVLNWLAVNVPWEAVLATGALTWALQLPKHWIKKWYKHYELIMILSAFVGSFGLVVLNYVQSNPTFAPQLLAVQAAAMAWMTQPWYRLIVKPMWAAAAKYLQTQISEAQFRHEAQTALVPANGLPITASPAEDFAA